MCIHVRVHGAHACWQHGMLYCETHNSACSPLFRSGSSLEGTGSRTAQVKVTVRTGMFTEADVDVDVKMAANVVRGT